MSEETPPQHVDLASHIGTAIAKRLMPILGEFGQEFLADVPVCEYHVRVVFDASQQKLVIVDHTETHIPPDVDTLVMFDDGTISSQSTVEWRQGQATTGPAVQADWELPEGPEQSLVVQAEKQAAAFLRFQEFEAKEALAAGKTRRAAPKKKAARKKNPRAVRPKMIGD